MELDFFLKVNKTIKRHDIIFWYYMLYAWPIL